MSSAFWWNSKSLLISSDFYNFRQLSIQHYLPFHFHGIELSLSPPCFKFKKKVQPKHPFPKHYYFMEKFLAWVLSTFILTSSIQGLIVSFPPIPLNRHILKPSLPCIITILLIVTLYSEWLSSLILLNFTIKKKNMFCHYSETKSLLFVSRCNYISNQRQIFSISNRNVAIETIKMMMFVQIIQSKFNFFLFTDLHSPWHTFSLNNFTYIYSKYIFSLYKLFIYTIINEVYIIIPISISIVILEIIFYPALFLIAINVIFSGDIMLQVVFLSAGKFSSSSR